MEPSHETSTYSKSVINEHMTYTYIVSIFERFCNPWIHIMMIQSHEKSVDHYTQGDKEVNEWIKDNERQVLKKM